MSEQAHLVMADRHIAEGLKRIAEQEERLRAAEAIGSVLAEGERLLANLKASLQEMRVHRELILDAIARGAS